MIFYGFMGFMAIFAEDISDKNKSHFSDFSYAGYSDNLNIATFQKLGLVFLPTIILLSLLGFIEKLGIQLWIFLGLGLLGMVMFFRNVYLLGVAFEWGFFSWIGFIFASIVTLFLALGFLADLAERLGCRV